MKAYLGIDVGSLTSKFVLINEKAEVLYWKYFRTEGNIISALKRGLRELRDWISETQPDIKISGVGTTGSGRQLAGVIVGADLIKNEVTCHTKGVCFFVPTARTVIEIGGQDSKIIILENGVAVDFAMNLICTKGNTEIITNPNFSKKKIKEAKIGQKVLTHKGVFKEIKQVFERRYKGEMIKIVASDLKKIELTPQHQIFSLKKGEEKPKFIPVEKLRVGDFITTPLIPEKRFKKLFQKNSNHSFFYKNWFFEPIKERRRYFFDGMVYNLKVEDDNSYLGNFIGLKNCAAGTGSFLDAQAFRLKIPIEKFGEMALRSKNPTVIASRCTVFAESDMIHKQQIGHKVEDIIAGLCEGLARNYLSSVGKGKKILPPVVFLGGVSENKGMRWAFEKILKTKIIVPKYNTVLGAFGVSLLVKENPPQKTKFRGFEISEKEIRCTSFQCHGCPNQCEVIEARIENKVVARWGDRCGKWSNLL